MTRQNFISVDKKTARNSYDNFFSVGERVWHQDSTAGSATILSFKADTAKNEVKVNTDKGYAHLDFLIKKDENS